MSPFLLLLALLPPQEPLPHDPIIDPHYEVEKKNTLGERERVAVIDGREAQPLDTELKIFRILDPRAVYYTPPADGRPSQKLTITAKVGIYDSQQETLLIRDNVSMIAEDGSLFSLEELSADFRNRTFRTPKAFLLEKKDARLSATGFEADDTFRRITAQKDAVLTILGDPRLVVKMAPNPGASRTCLACSGTMTIRELFSPPETGEQRIHIVAQDNVRLESDHPDGPLSAKCDHLDLTLLKKSVKDPMGTPPPPDGPAPPPPDYRIDIVDAHATGRVVLSQEDARTRKTAWSVQGETALWNEQDRRYRISGENPVTCTLENTAIHAPRVEVDPDRGRIFFFDGVVISGLAHGGTGPLSAVGAEMEWNHRTERGVLVGRPLVRLEQEGRTVEATRVCLVGRSLAVLQGFKRIRLRTPPRDGREPMEVAATCDDDAFVETGAGIVRMSGRCIVRTREFTMTSDRLRLLTEGEQSLLLPSGDILVLRPAESTLLASGDVRVLRPAESMTLFGTSLRFDTNQEVILVRGRPYVVAETPESCHYWGPTRIEQATRRIEASAGTEPMYSILIHKPKEKAR